MSQLSVGGLTMIVVFTVDSGSGGHFAVVFKVTILMQSHSKWSSEMSQQSVARWRFQGPTKDEVLEMRNVVGSEWICEIHLCDIVIVVQHSPVDVCCATSIQM